MTVYNEDATTRMLRSSFGKQVLAEKLTEPAYGQGTSQRDAYLKLYLSKSQAKAMSGNNSQGAVYNYVGAMGPQPQSKYQSSANVRFGTSGRSIKYGTYGPGPGAYNLEGALGNKHETNAKNSPRAVIGTATRDGQSKVWLDEEMMRTEAGKDTPGPASYKTPSGVGKQPDAMHSSQPAWKQGTEPRFRGRSDSKDFPGAGAYGTGVPAHGPQPQSAKPTLPMPKMGTSTRDHALKVFISKRHEKGAVGYESPGPTTANMIDSIGPQVQATKTSNPCFGFGTSKRDAGPKNETPGPGTYYA